VRWFISKKLFCDAGLGFVTSLVFVFFVGVFVSSWIGSTIFWLGEWFIKRMPFVKHLYSASKQISAAISPGYDKLSIFDCMRGSGNEKLVPTAPYWLGSRSCFM